MALQSSGAISLSQVNTELSLAAGATVSLNDAKVRTLAGIGSGAIGLNSLYGKSAIAEIFLTIASNQTNLNLATWATANGWIAGKKLTVTINSGVYILASSTGNYALTVPASFSAGLTIINNGAIVGAGGAGGQGGGYFNATRFHGDAGGAGGPAIYAGQSFSLVNNGYVAGGGGGGGGAGGWIG